MLGIPTLARQKQSLVHIAYFVTILIKGLFGLFEVTGGLVIAIAGPQWLYSQVLHWTTPELYQGGPSHLALVIRQGAAALVQTQAGFIILYLLVHGALKMAITITLLRGKGVWIFPFSSVILLGFIAYMSYELSLHWSYLLLALALLDTVTLALVLNEWRTWKDHPHPAIKELKEELAPH